MISLFNDGEGFPSCAGAELGAAVVEKVIGIGNGSRQKGWNVEKN